MTDQAREKSAANIVGNAVSGQVTVPDAMVFAGMSQEVSKDRTAQARVRRLAEKIRVSRGADALRNLVEAGRQMGAETAVSAMRSVGFADSKLNDVALVQRVLGAASSSGKSTSAIARSKHSESTKRGVEALGSPPPTLKRSDHRPTPPKQNVGLNSTNGTSANPLSGQLQQQTIPDSNGLYGVNPLNAHLQQQQQLLLLSANGGFGNIGPTSGGLVGASAVGQQHSLNAHFQQQQQLFSAHGIVGGIDSTLGGIGGAGIGQQHSLHGSSIS